MSSDKKKSLEKILSHKTKNITLSDVVKKYFNELLFENLISKDSSLLPITYLLKSNLSSLLSLNKYQLVKLINYLSLYDLVKEMKYLVDTKYLKKIYSFLTSDEKKFLNKILKYNEPFSTKRLNLEKFNLEKKTIRNILHKRGLERLAYAISSQNEDFIWYIMHFLDIGRAMILEKLIRKNKNLGISDIIISQIFYVLENNMSNL
ncbi:MAG: hypothetical protein K1060chlam5_00107 [Candidatus Anoxychlamydiales bacterium]|nr:hypothetical protein [Candidatus Anoxychlamydiales bacterium]